MKNAAANCDAVGASRSDGLWLSWSAIYKHGRLGVGRAELMAINTGKGVLVQRFVPLHYARTSSSALRGVIRGDLDQRILKRETKKPYQSVMYAWKIDVVQLLGTVTTTDVIEYVSFLFS